jgi:hypothetical protein
MTPKEKAEDLLSKYYFQVQTLDKQKQCALIAVDEIIAANPNLKWFAKLDDSIKYWQEVKQEIEKI